MAIWTTARSTESVGRRSAADPLAPAGTLIVLLATSFQWVTALGPLRVTWTGATAGLRSPPPPQAGTMPTMTVSTAAIPSVQWLRFIVWLSIVARQASPRVNNRSARVDNHDGIPMN